MKTAPISMTILDQTALLSAGARSPRESLWLSLALGTGLRLAELIGLDVADAYTAGGTPRIRVRLRADIAKRVRVGDVFLPDALPTVNRSVIGALNEFVFLMQLLREEGPLPHPRALSYRLSDTLVGIGKQKYVHPRDEARRLLEEDR